MQCIKHDLLTVQLSGDTNDDLGQDDAIIDPEVFLAMVAHQIKQPTSLMSGWAQLLLADLETELDAEHRGYLRHVVQSGRHLSEIVDNMLLIGQYANPGQIPRNLLDMEYIVDVALGRLQDQIKTSEAQITLPDEWIIAYGYAPWIEEVWVNYISNALKYGGSPPYIELECAYHGSDWARFWVKDHGPGMSEADQARLFAPYTRLQPTASEGHGLGLFTAKIIVNRLGGEVLVESESGVGSVFGFTLPAGPITNEDYPQKA